MYKVLQSATRLIHLIQSHYLSYVCDNKKIKTTQRIYLQIGRR